MIDHALECAPFECCGVIAGRGETVEKIIKMENEASSNLEYSMNDAQLKRALASLDDEGIDFIGVYHSHPKSIPYPSQVDIAKASLPELFNVIISLLDKKNPSLKAFKIAGNIVCEIAYRVV